MWFALESWNNAVRHSVFPNIGTVQQQTEAAKWCWQMWKSNNHCGPTCSHLASKIDKMELGSCEPLLLASVCSTVSSMKSAPSHDRDGLLDLFPARVAPCFREHCLSHSRNILTSITHLYTTPRHTGMTWITNLLACTLHRQQMWSLFWTVNLCRKTLYQCSARVSLQQTHPMIFSTRLPGV